MQFDCDPALLHPTDTEPKFSAERVAVPPPALERRRGLAMRRGSQCAGTRIPPGLALRLRGHPAQAIRLSERALWRPPVAAALGGQGLLAGGDRPGGRAAVRRVHAAQGGGGRRGRRGRRVAAGGRGGARVGARVRLRGTAVALEVARPPTVLARRSTVLARGLQPCSRSPNRARAALNRA
eukprot:3165268-Prymnesium_polylepis.1